MAHVWALVVAHDSTPLWFWFVVGPGMAFVLLLFPMATIFGGVGAVIGPPRGYTRLHGFVLGTLLGPFGWLLMLVRRGQRSDADIGPTRALDVLGTGPLGDVPRPHPQRGRGRDTVLRW